MANPFFTNNNAPQLNMNYIKQVYNMLQNSTNPMALLNQMAQTNPQLAQVVNLIKNNNGNYEQTFRNMCKQRGINADEFIRNLNNNT